MTEEYRKFHSGRFDGVLLVDHDKKEPSKEATPTPPTEKGKFLNEVETKTETGTNYGKLRDKSRKKLQDMGID